MNILTKKQSFNDKNGNLITYDKLYTNIIMFDLSFEFNFKFHDTFKKQIVLSNLDNAYVKLIEKPYKRNGVTDLYITPVIAFKNNSLEVPLKCSSEQAFILKLNDFRENKENGGNK